MLGFLAGVPGKLKALNDRLTSTWAAKLDALRTGLTDVRMGYLDKLNITGNAASSAEVAACAQKTDPMLNIPTLLCLGATTVVDQSSTTNDGWMAPASPACRRRDDHQLYRRAQLDRQGGAGNGGGATAVARDLDRPDSRSLSMACPSGTLERSRRRPPIFRPRRPSGR
ncbi:MAG: hypothetical protein IPF74_15915 [Rhodocyclaceae bacterium]|nr:hypothetical protein [Rhodocyclaceae bacterium]